MNTLSNISLEYLEQHLPKDVLDALVNKRMKKMCFPFVVTHNALIELEKDMENKEEFLKILQEFQFKFPSLIKEYSPDFFEWNCKKEEHFDCSHSICEEIPFLTNGFYIYEQCDVTCTCGGISAIFFRGEKDGTYFGVIGGMDFDFDTNMDLINFFGSKYSLLPHWLKFKRS